MDINRLKTHLSRAFDAVAAMHVTGDDQERAVACKQALQAAYQLLQEQERESEVSKDA